jgi:hypothetical protein
VAVPPLRVAVFRVVPATEKVTLPVGAGLEQMEVIVAVRAVLLFCATVAGFAETVVVVGAKTTVKKVEPEEGALLASPL